jgi:biopolymer transport protein ExbD
MAVEMEVPRRGHDRQKCIRRATPTVGARFMKFTPCAPRAVGHYRFPDRHPCHPAHLFHRHDHLPIISHSFKSIFPRSKSAETGSAERQPTLVLVRQSAEEITLDEKPVTLESLAASLKTLRDQAPQRPIAMQADREAPFGVVVKVLDALREAGVKNIPAFTQPEQKK